MPEGDPPPTRPAAKVLAAVFLIAPFVALLWVPSYSREKPRLGGFPFFYWYQLLWVIITAVLIGLAYVLTRVEGELEVKNVHGLELGIFIFFFVLVTVVGFAAARWRRGPTLMSLDEWGLGGRSFGTWVTWFLLGGDLYTAYTFIAVPAACSRPARSRLLRGALHDRSLYPIIFVFMPRLWSVSHRHGYVTPADFVRGRYGSRALALAIAVTGIVATMPYIALQLVGIQAVLDVMGVGGTGSWFAKDLPLFIAFVVLAAYTYTSGLRAPALIAFVKDALIYLVIIVGDHLHPVKLGGWGHIFGAAQAKTGQAEPGDAASRPARSVAHEHDALGLRHARARLGAGAVHVSALDHRDARRPRAAT